jgi:glycine/D-amino acid oxidase-like deaminating enzyme
MRASFELALSPFSMQFRRMDLRRFSYWESELPPEPLPPSDLPARVDVLFVGAGFMGRWLAYFLTRLRNPPRVLVIERDRFSYGASTRNAGFLTCGQVSEMLADSKASGIDAAVQTFLQRRAGIEIVQREFPDLDFDACGSTDYDDVTGDTLELVNRLNGAAGEELYTVRASRLGAEVRQAVFNKADGGLHPVRQLRLLWRRRLPFQQARHQGIEASRDQGERSHQ